MPAGGGGLSRTAEAEYLARSGLRFVIGLDEAGRGPLAGPVVCAAVLLLDSGVPVEGIMDSKKLVKEEDREAAYESLVRCPGVCWGVAIVSHEEIDAINILQASLIGMKRATDDLLSKYPSVDKKQCLALADGNAVPSNMPVTETQCIVKGDSLIYSIAAASIIAKVTRDRIMQQQSDLYPVYAFSQHKGYPTAQHRAALMEHGACPIHRKTYSPVKIALERHAKLLLSPPPPAPDSSTGKRTRRQSNQSTSPQRRSTLDMSTPPPSPAKTRRR